MYRGRCTVPVTHLLEGATVGIIDKARKPPSAFDLRFIHTNSHHITTHTHPETTTKNGSLTHPPPPSIRTPRPLRPLLPQLPQEHPLLSNPPLQSPRDNLNLIQPTTASSQQTCLPSKNSPRHTPQPAFQQDFQLFARPTQAPPRPQRQRSNSLALIQQATSNRGNSLGYYPASKNNNNNNNNSNNNITSSPVHRTSLPAVPTFPWITNVDVTMVSTEPNVAYDGTSSDLGVGAGSFFKPNADFNNLFCLDGDLFDTDFTHGNFTPNNMHESNSSTISPQELLMDSMNSVPSSTAFPDLTPGSDMLETPNTSPLFDILTTNEQWPSLFAEAGAFDEADTPASAAPPFSRQDSTSSQVLVHPGGEAKRMSSVSASPICLGARPSTVAGIRKKSKPLPAIVVDETDPIAVKRARNTAAARKSREKKNAHTDALEARIAELEQMVADRDATIAQLRSGGASASVNVAAEDFDLSALL